MSDRRSQMVRIGGVYAVFFGAIAVIYPYFPIFLRLRGLSPSRIGLSLGLMEVMGLLAPMVISKYADRTGRFRLVMAVSVLLAASFVLAMNFAQAFTGLLAAALGFGFFFKPIIPLNDALTGRALVDSSANYGKVRVWGTISFIVVSLVLQFSRVMETGSSWRFTLVFLAAFAAQFLILPLAPSVAPHPNDSPTKSQRIGGMPRGFFSFLAVGFVGNIGFAAYQSFGSLYFSEVVGVSGVSGLHALSALAEIPALLFGGLILRKIGHRKMLFTAQAAGILRLLMLALLPSTVPIALSQFLHAFVYGFYLIAGVDWVNRIVPMERRGMGMGLFMAISFSGSQLVGSLLGGFVLETSGFSPLFGAAAVFPALGMIWLTMDKRIGDNRRLDDGG